MSWIRQNWKLLLASVAGFVIVILLYLRTRSSAAPAGSISFPGSAAAGDAGAPPAPGSLPAAIQQFLGTIRAPGAAPNYDPGRKGVPLWSGIGLGSILQLIPWGANVQILDTAQGPPNPISGETTYYKVDFGGIIGWISSFDLASFLGSPPAGFGQSPAPSAPAPSPFFPAPAPASGTPTANPVPITPFPSARLGVGGPGAAVVNLHRAALAAQAAAHSASLTSPRLSARLRHDALQAAREGQRVNVESRGAAPVGGPGAIASGLRRVRWPR